MQVASETVLQYLLGGIGKLSKGLTGKLAKSIGNIDNALLKMAANGTLNVIKESGEEYLQALLEPVYGNIILWNIKKNASLDDGGDGNAVSHTGVSSDTFLDTALDGGRHGQSRISSGASSVVSNNSIPPLSGNVKGMNRDWTELDEATKEWL